MQQTTGVAVLATHLAQTDRRALSQAWYSALHLAGDAPGPRAPALATAPRSPAHSAASRPAGVVSPAHAAPAEPRGARVSTAGRTSHRRGTADGSRSDALAVARHRDASAGTRERRVPKGPLARTIERGLRAERAPGGAAADAGTASFVVRSASGRVQVVVRCCAGITRVVAVCAPPLRERVERALAQARFALAGAGMRIDAQSRLTCAEAAR